MDMKKKYIAPYSTVVAVNTESLLSTSPGEGINVGDKTDEGFEELSREQEEHHSIWDKW